MSRAKAIGAVERDSTKVASSTTSVGRLPPDRKLESARGCAQDYLENEMAESLECLFESVRRRKVG